MNINQTLYLFFDYDNTVCVKGVVSQQTIQAMQAAHNAGHKLILCTGRARGSAISNLSALPWDGMIYGGADIVYQTKVLETREANLQDVFTWLDFCMENRVQMILEGQKEIVRYPFDTMDLSDAELKDRDFKREIADLSRTNPITKLSILVLNFPKEKLPKTRMNPLIHPQYIEVFGEGRDKGVAIRRFCELLGASIDQCACFGDSMNDYAMFLECPVGICMKWAPQALIDISTYHAQTDDGVAEGLQWLLKPKE